MLWGKTYGFWLGVLLIAVLSYITLFHELGTAAMREWDEARNSLNAINMLHSGNYLVRVYNGVPDMWETKPPLFVWLQVISIKIFGYSEWAFRLPSALSALATVMVMARFLYRQTRSIIPGMAATVVLLTTYTYTLHHCATTADHEALLILFELCLVIAFYNYLQATDTATKNRQLLYCFIYFTLAVYTKSIAVFMLLPGVFIYSLYQWKILEILKQPRFYLYTIASLSIIALYYLLHEWQTPGYLQAVWGNELFPRYFNTDNTYSYDRVESPLTYFYILNRHSIAITVFIPAAIVACINKQYRRPAVYFIVVAVVFYVVASVGTYNPWYINPIVPLLAVVCGFGVYIAYNYIIEKTPEYLKVQYMPAVLFALAVALAYEPIRLQLHQQAMIVDNYGGIRSYGRLFKAMRTNHPEVRTFKIYFTGRINQTMQFYYELYTKLYGYNLLYVTNAAALAPNDIVMTVQQGLQQAIKNNYNVKPLATFADGVVYKLAPASR